MEIPGFYEFYCPVKTVAGHDVLEKIPELLTDLNAARPMLITDKGVSKAGLCDMVTTAVNKKVKICSVEDDVPPDSDLKVVNHLAGVYKEKQCDAIIAVGGGSVLDTAKGVNILVSEKAGDLMRFAGAGALRKKLKPLIAVPTTSGTGSEVTQAAVIADHEKSTKMLFSSHFLLPDIAVLDSRMTLTLPPAITAATAMDALTHAVEAYTCLQKNPMSDASAVAAIELISRNLMPVIQHPDDADGRLALAVGANLAGIAFSNAMVGMVHALGHSVGAVCQAPHGSCMAILLAYGLEYNMHKNGHYTAQLLLPLAGPDLFALTPSHLRAEKTILFIRGLNEQLHKATNGKHARCFKEMLTPDGQPMVPKTKLEDIARKAMGDGCIFYNPEEMDYDDFFMVMEHAWEGIALDRDLIRKG